MKNKSRLHQGIDFFQKNVGMTLKQVDIFLLPEKSAFEIQYITLLSDKAKKFFFLLCKHSETMTRSALNHFRLTFIDAMCWPVTH